MAAQIWDPIEQRYKSVDLAQYGQDGNLDGAYAWIDGRWATLWKRTPDAPDYTWTDDFTAPTLHERWMVVVGDYAPPGLTDAVLLGPDLGDTFDLMVDAQLDGGSVLLTINDADFQGVAFLEITADQVALEAYDQVSAVNPGMPITLRRADGEWFALANGEVLTDDLGRPLRSPDTHTGPAHLAINAQGSTVTFVGYTDLT